MEKHIFKQKTTIKVTCDHCGREFKIGVDFEDYREWKSGRKVAQVAFPYLTPDERELLISKTCGECWDKIAPEPKH